ncbi:zona pellucida sperm-binding protein 4-like [Sparus aurata]|uniref:Zona pellucida sperm-binding protein 4-like n=1 Tax=Sparus aurata TaxID=8175 RepID=A0A671W2T2_SPAAU|nr:zona pellucida sperm-binding protein 4-like [Sparus aurata]
MAGVRVEVLLLVLTVTLLLVSVQGWDPIDSTELENFYESGQWAAPQTVTATDDRSEFDASEDVIPVYEFPDVEGAATTDGFSSSDNGFELETEDFGPGNWPSRNDGGYQVDFVDAPPRSWASSSSKSSSELDVVCGDDDFQITLPKGPLNEVKVLGSKEVLSIMDAPAFCGYDVNSYEHTLTVPFTGCNVKLEANCKTNRYSLQLLYIDDLGETKIATTSCEAMTGPSLRSGGQPTAKCSPPVTPSKAQNCAVVTGERVTCGQSGMSSSECEKMGCCVDPSTKACYYPLDECTGDQHFVFAIRSNTANINVDPKKLVIPGFPNCKPVIVNDNVAIFKFKVTECGARSYTVENTKLYLAEVQSVVQALNLKYGIITRSNPLRFMVECRYSETGDAKQSLATVGYMVKTPASTLPTSVISNGLYSVELRLAEDQTYSKYLATTSLPLRLLLGKPVYLELRLKSPKPDAVILVNYCIAYPRSAKNALVLVYEGCANPYDPNVSILQVAGTPKNRYQRRFVVKAFQFMDQKTNQYLNEEIYFMCSAEVCRTAEKTCAERCFDGKAP